jgi:hypothetical protein
MGVDTISDGTFEHGQHTSNAVGYVQTFSKPSFNTGYVMERSIADNCANIHGSTFDPDSDKNKQDPCQCVLKATPSAFDPSTLTPTPAATPVLIVFIMTILMTPLQLMLESKMPYRKTWETHAADKGYDLSNAKQQQVFQRRLWGTRAITAVTTTIALALCIASLKQANTTCADCAERIGYPLACAKELLSTWDPTYVCLLGELPPNLPPGTDPLAWTDMNWRDSMLGKRFLEGCAGCKQTSAVGPSFVNFFLSFLLQQPSDAAKGMLVFFITQQLIAAAVIAAGKLPTNCHPVRAGSWLFAKLPANEIKLKLNFGCFSFEQELPCTQAYYSKKAAETAKAAVDSNAEYHLME